MGEKTQECIICKDYVFYTHVRNSNFVIRKATFIGNEKQYLDYADSNVTTDDAIIVCGSGSIQGSYNTATAGNGYIRFVFSSNMGANQYKFNYIVIKKNINYT